MRTTLSMMLVSSYLSSRAGRQSASLLRKCSVTRFNQRSRDSSSSTADTEWNTIEKFAASLKDGKYKRILIVAGAGVSCSAGIPDFRTPGTGIYDNLQKYNLPNPGNNSSNNIWSGYELDRSIFALTNLDSAPPITTDAEILYQFKRIDENRVEGRLRLAEYLNPQSDQLYFEARNRAVSINDYTLSLTRIITT